MVFGTKTPTIWVLGPFGDLLVPRMKSLRQGEPCPAGFFAAPNPGPCTVTRKASFFCFKKTNIKLLGLEMPELFKTSEYS